MQATISLLIPTLNRPNALRQTLDTYFSGSVLPEQLIVVDQSADEAVRRENKAVVASYSPRAETVYFYQAEPSSTKARNRAISLSHGDILVFSDDDVDVLPDTLRHVRSLMADESVSMLGGIDEYMPVPRTKACYLMGTQSFRKRKRGHVTASMLGRFPEDSTGEHETEWAMGFFFVVRSSLLERWGIRWDEKLTSYAYAEDLDFSYSYYKKSRSEGLRCLMNDALTVRHRASREYRIPSRKHVFMYIINRAYLSYKHQMGWRSELAMAWCNLWMLLTASLRQQKSADYRDAIRRCRAVRPLLKQGTILPEFYR